MDIKYVTQIINGIVNVSDQDFVMRYSTDEELAILVRELIGKGYAFTHEPAGWPPAEIVQSLKDRGLVQHSFIAITWCGPEDYRTYEVV